jgi:glycine C-acetyltransferase
MSTGPRSTLSDALTADLDQVQADGLWRELREVQSAQEPAVVLRGREVLLFCSNNYLGLANHPEVVEASREAAAQFGASAGSSRLISGHMSPHRELEERIASWKGVAASLVFSTGYQANLGAITSLVGPDDVVLSDELNHASIIDATRLARGTTRVFRHNDLDHLEALLKESDGAGRVLIATEAIFSMDGDAAPLAEMGALARRYGAWLLVDEAHSVGVFGRDGAGLVDELGIDELVDVRVGTLGKALGSFGAYVAGSRPLVDLLVNRARSFIFTTGLPPSAVAASSAAIAICQREPKLGVALRGRVRELADRLREVGLDVPHAQSQILPVRIGDSARTVELMQQLLEDGVYVAAIRPPTVPKGTSRLRFSVMASHSPRQLDRAVEALTRRCS